MSPVYTRSERNPGITSPKRFLARFSGRKGRQFLSPAKAGFGFLALAIPRAALRVTSFRAACPGLKSAAGSAGSLNGSVAKLLSLAGFLLLLAACSTGIHSGTGGLPPALSSSPPAISSSADVVKVRVANVSLPANGKAEATVTLSITPGFHINANPASYSYLIPTEVRGGKETAEIPSLIGKPVYPAPVMKKFVFAEKLLAVYEGEVAIKVPLIFPDIHGQESFPVYVRIQACDNEKCYPPANLNASITIK